MLAYFTHNFANMSEAKGSCKFSLARLYIWIFNRMLDGKSFYGMKKQKKKV